MNFLLLSFLLCFSACTPHLNTTQKTTDSSQTPSSVPLSPKSSDSSSKAIPETTSAYSGTAYLKGLQIEANGSYSEVVTFEGSATLNANNELNLLLKTECGFSSQPYQTAQIIIQLNPQTRTWKQLSHEYKDCDGSMGALENDIDEQYQPYTIERGVIKSGSLDQTTF